MKNQELRSLLQEQYKLIERHEEISTDEEWKALSNEMTEMSHNYPPFNPLHNIAYKLLISAWDIIEDLYKRRKESES